MKRFVIFKIILAVILTFGFMACEGKAYEYSEKAYDVKSYEVTENQVDSAGFIDEHLMNFIQSPLDSDFNTRFKDLFITKDVSQFNSLPALNTYYNTLLFNPQEFYYDSPLYSVPKNCFNIMSSPF